MEDDRQTKLEINVSHLSYAYDQLNGVLVDQAKTLRTLDSLLRNLQGRVARIERRMADDGQSDDETEGFLDLDEG